MERLGLGPGVLLARHPPLVYGRMTGWGQTGPYAHVAGHDINYVAMAGALHGCGRAGQRPTAPMNLLGDFGGGGMMLAFGMVSAILAARATGRGQVVDCAMIDGAALLSTTIWGWRAAGVWNDERGFNILDSGAHFYDTYRCADDRFVAIGAIEPKFYAGFLRLIGQSEDSDFQAQWDRAKWPELKARLDAIFTGKTRDEWCAIMERSDICFAPVLSMAEAAGHPQNAARETFSAIGGIVQPMPAPRFSATPAAQPRPPSQPGADTDALLAEIGYDPALVAGLRDRRVVA